MLGGRLKKVTNQLLHTRMSVALSVALSVENPAVDLCAENKTTAATYEVTVTWYCPNTRVSHWNRMDITLPLVDGESIDDVVRALVQDPAVQRENPCAGTGHHRSVCGHVGFYETTWSCVRVA